MYKKLLLLILLSYFGLQLCAQTLINTSFETADNYTVGSVHNKNKWTVTAGSGEIVSNSDYVKEGAQALKLASNSTALQVDNISYSSNTTALGGDVYLDFWINLKALPSVNFGITGYDLGTLTNRSFMMEFQPSGKIKLYDGSSGWSTQPLYTANTWNRISIKIDNSGAKCQYAIDGVVIDKLFSFREIKAGATNFDFHSLRFSMNSGTADIAIDNLYIGSSPIADINFQSSSNDRTITVTQPAYGSITLSPVKTVYQLNDQITATISVPEHYSFTGWTGDVTGSENPVIFTVSKNMTLGANVVIDTNNPPAQSVVTVTQPVGGTITLSPAQTSFYNGSTVKVTLNLQSGYQFDGWTGSLSGTTNPLTFVVNQDITIGASVSEIQVSSTKRVVSTVTQFKDALAAMNPGDTVLVQDGTYNLGGVKVIRGGSGLKPIIVMSKNLHGAKITGASTLSLSAISFVTFSGFDFNLEPVSTIFKMEGCSYVRITRNKFQMKNLTDTQTSKWITVGEVWENEVCNSHHNRIDHNLFDGKYDQGAWVIIDGSHGTIPAISQHDLIDHNIFRNNTPRVTNEKETIRLGVSDLSHKDAFTTVEYNLFEDCDGDPEIVSVKSNCDTVRYNTFRRCLGTISLRQGNNSVVAGNFVFGEGKTAVFDGSTIGCGGVRVYGLNHKIYNNYFEGLTGSKWDAACTLTNGDVTNTSTSLSSHFLPENIVFTNNTLINNVSNIEIGFNNNGEYGKAPVNCKLANNIVVANLNPVVKYYSTTSLAGVNFENNIIYTTGTSTLGLDGTSESQIKIIDPLLVLTSSRIPVMTTAYKTPFSVYKLSPSSPAINNSVGYQFVTTDFENQSASGVRDIGADEFNTDAAITNGPLSDLQAGPTAPEVYEYEKYEPTATSIIKTNQISAFPNPFVGSTRLSIPVNKAGKIIISIYNSQGQLIQKMEDFSSVGTFNSILNLTNKGLLFCKIDQNDESCTIKLNSK